MAKDKVLIPSMRIGLNPPGIVYGGLIYSAASTAGFNGEPTTLNVNVALDAALSSTLGNQRHFSIDKSSLDLTAPVDIFFGNANFYSNMFLTSYEQNESVDNKTLSLRYSDGSVLLDRIFVGLIHEHFEINPIKHGVPNLVELNVKCPKKITQNTSVSSYSNNKDQSNPNSTDGNYTVCSATETITSTRRVFRPLANPTGNPNFNYRVIRQNNNNIWAGGYIILGKEEFSESKCAIRDVSYSYRDLITAIKSFGINVDLSRFPNRRNIDQLSKSYTGTIRDVLQNWVNDLGVTFFWNSKNSKPTLSIVSLSDRSIQYKFEEATKAIEALDKGHGSDMVSGSNTVINSKVHGVDLDGTYSQAFSSVLTRGPSAKQRTKEASEAVLFKCQTINTIGKEKTIGLTGSDEPIKETFINDRRYDDFFTSMCLGKYAPSVRDPYNVRKAINYYDSKQFTDENDNTFYPTDAEPYFRALGLREVIPFTFGEFQKDTEMSSLLRTIEYALGLNQLGTEAYKKIDIHYGKDYKADFHVFLGVYDENLKSTVSKFEDSISGNFIGRHFALSAPAAEYFDCTPYYKVLETLETVPSSTFYGQSQHYKTPMAEFLEDLKDLTLDGLVTSGDLYKSQLYDDLNELIENFKSDCEENNPFFNDDREKGFFHFQRNNAPWFANKTDIDNLLNPFRLADVPTTISRDTGVYASETIASRVKYDIMAAYQPQMYPVPLVVGSEVRRYIERIESDLSGATPAQKELIRLLSLVDKPNPDTNKIVVCFVLKGDRDKADTFDPMSIGDIQIKEPHLKRNTIEEINALQSLCNRTNQTLKRDVDECQTVCETDFVEDMCSSNILGQTKLNCADLENIRDSAFSIEMEPDRAGQIKGLAIQLKRNNPSRVVGIQAEEESTEDKKEKFYSDTRATTTDKDIHFIVAPSQNHHKGILKYTRDHTVTDFGQRKVFDGLHQTFPPIMPTVSSVKYQTQDITQDVVSVYDPDKRQGIIEGEIPIELMAQLTGQISSDGDSQYLTLQNITAQNYHNVLKSNISSQQVITPRESVTYKVYIDQSSGLVDLMTYVSIEYGLESVSLLADAGGYYLDITLSNRPPIDPSLDALFRKVGPIAKAGGPRMSFLRSM